ncbi:hypothetical protein Bbelb_255850 [Branchiostoma belcheri]|nr:hypothetical protein Bbelb_255850 [Branchiostoma belcheri]
MMYEAIRRVCKSRLVVLIFGIVIGGWAIQIFTVQEVQYAKEPQKDAKDFPTIPNRLVQAYHGPTEPRHHPKDPQWLKESPLSAGQGRKILLDCGANVASTVQLFRETYPGGHDFIIHSFEIDERLAPFFAPYPNHVLHSPTGVSNKDGNMTAYLESAWSPDKGKVSSRDMQWGGGTLFAWDSEKADIELGGRRKLSLRPTVPTVDLSRWIQENTAVEDYVIFKLDVEGAEYDILKKMLADGTFKWVDKYYGEYHPTQPVTGWNEEEMLKLKSEVNTKGKHMLVWKGELRTYQDFNTMNPPLVPGSFVGSPGTVYSSCHAAVSGQALLTLAVLVGMNAKAAHKLIATIAAHSSRMPNQPFPLGDFSQQASNWIRLGLVSAIQRLSEVGLIPAFYFPENITDMLIEVAKDRGLRIIQPTARFPPTDVLLGQPIMKRPHVGSRGAVGSAFDSRPREQWRLSFENYYINKDVNRIPKALRVIAKQLDSKGGIVTLNSDHPDSYMISVFLMDYLVEKSGYNIVSISECLE